MYNIYKANLYVTKRIKLYDFVVLKFKMKFLTEFTRMHIDDCVEKPMVSF